MSHAGFDPPICTPNRPPMHGAKVTIGYSPLGFVHYDGCAETKPLVRSYRNGVRVGCTFITSEALDEVHRLHRKFISNLNEFTHQQGDE